jgi:uncharacterized protein YndB with AHSA1/START domain
MQVDSSFFAEIHKPPAVVWNALTTSEELRQWFDPGGRIEPREGGFIEALSHTQFRGRFRRGQVLLARAPETLVWVFPVTDVPGKVTWRVTPSDYGSRIQVRHEVPERAEEMIPPRDGAEALIHYWFQNLTCLKYWLDIGVPPNRVQYRELPDMETQADVSLVLPAASEILWSIMTTASELDMWISAKAYVDLRQGGRFAFGWDHGAERIIELEPCRKLSFNWNYRNQETLVTWSLEPSDTLPGMTRVRIQHSGFGSENRSLMHDYHEGWLTLLHSLGIYAITKEACAKWFGKI